MVFWTQNDFYRNIKRYLENLPDQPGIYQMVDAVGKILYIGKANNLKNRVSSYFISSAENSKNRRNLLDQVHHIEIILTKSETEALILECNLIRSLKPKYNLCLKEGRGYPYIHLSNADTYPQFSICYGTKILGGQYFGPYPDTTAAYNTLRLLQKTFLLRQCKDSVFKNRRQPCLQYQLKYCSAPCVNAISVEDYRNSIHQAILFLEGKNQVLIDYCIHKMQYFAKKQYYEKAVVYRNQITQLRKIQDQQSLKNIFGHWDIITCILDQGICCIQVFFIRSGMNLGGRVFYPTLPDILTTTDSLLNSVLRVFILQFYQHRHDIPENILLNIAIDDHTLIEEILSLQVNKAIHILYPHLEEHQQLLAIATFNATHAIQQRLLAENILAAQFQALESWLNISVSRIDAFDVSHWAGQCTVSSCVVFDRTGPCKSQYRIFNIDSNKLNGDDLAALKETLIRRYKHFALEDMPSLILVDGGKLQVDITLRTLKQLGMNTTLVLGIAKGVDRDARLEKLIISSCTNEWTWLAQANPVFILLQNIRNEAHRFAIKKQHRQEAKRVLNVSTLEAIPGIGKRRQQILLQQFGNMRMISQASIDEIIRIPGFNEKLAKSIYDYFHPCDRDISV